MSLRADQDVPDWVMTQWRPDGCVGTLRFARPTLADDPMDA
jgi:hypothetical protein